MMSAMNKITNSATESQRWAREQGACFEGRQALGTKSIGAFFNDPKSEPCYLVYIARRLNTANPLDQQLYLVAVQNAWNGGRWGTKHTHAALIRIFARFNVSIPARLL